MIFQKHRCKHRGGRTGWISREDRLAIYQRDDFRCVYCDSTMYLQLDHIHPRSKGGSDHARNLATACRSCNMAKSNRIIAGRTRRTKIANYRRERMSRNSRKSKYNHNNQRRVKAKRRGEVYTPTMHAQEKPRNLWLWLVGGIFLLIIL